MEPDRTQNITKSFERGKSPLLIGKRLQQYYRGSRCQDRFIAEDYDEFLEYLKKEAGARDIIDVHDLSESWSSKDEPIVSGKCPDERGEIPRKGAY